MMRLLTFGGISVLGEDGITIRLATAQRRPVAVVVLLAAHGQRGLTRDKLCALLWPDVDDRRARHSLTQALYAARKAFGRDDLFVIGGSIRLNERLIASDIADFAGALDAGSFEAATSIYVGPFLDGFVVPGCNEFDQWVSVRRAELEDRMVFALDRIATDVARRGDVARALDARRRLVAMRPWDTTFAAGLVTLLATSGNSGEALRQAEHHEAVLRRELDAAPAAEFQAIVQRLRRATPAVDAPSRRVVALPPHPPAPGGSAPRLASPAVLADGPRVIGPPRRRLFAAAAVALALLAVARVREGVGRMSQSPTTATTTLDDGALRRYRAGRSADARRDYVQASRNYKEALALDTTFGAAALRLAVASDRLGNAEMETDALARAWAQRGALDGDERALLLAFVGPQYPRPSLVAEQLAAWEHVVRRDQRSARAWYQLAARLFRDGARLGAATTIDQTRLAIHRALALDAGYEPAQQLDYAVADSVGSAAPVSIQPLEYANLTYVRWVAMASQWTVRRRAEGVRALSLLDSSATTTDERIDAALAEHSLALNESRVGDALAWTRRLHQLRPDSHAHLRLRVLDALYGGGDQPAAEAAAGELARPTEAAFNGFPLFRRRQSADACVMAQWRLAHADTSGVRGVIELLRNNRVQGDAPPVSATSGVCSELLEVALAVVTHQPDALSRLEHVDSLMLTAAVAGNAAAYAHIMLARLYGRMGQPHRALAAIRKRSYMLGWPAYLATTWREEWRLAARVGDVRDAELAQQQLLAMRAASHS